MGRLKEAMLVKEEEARLADLKRQMRAEAKAKAKRAADKIAKEEEMKLRAERRRDARSEAELIALGREFGYKNPEFWAAKVWAGRQKGGWR